MDKEEFFNDIKEKAQKLNITIRKRRVRKVL